MSAKDITVVQGDTHKFNVTVTDENGSAFDLTSYTMTFTAKKSITDTTAAITSTGVISNPTTGIGLITLTPTDTDIEVNDYHYQIEISDGSDNVYTIVYDSILSIIPQLN